MMEVPRSLNDRDVHQWLNGGWIDVDGTAYKFYGCDGTQITYIDDNGNYQNVSRRDVSAHWPQCGAVNIDGYAVILKRSSRQQYRRTYNSRVLEMEVPRKWDVMKAKGCEIAQTPDDAAVVRAAFAPRYYDYDEAVRMLDNGWATVAMTPYIVLAGDSDEHLMYYRGVLHGTIRAGVITPIGEDPRTVARLLKFFNGRVNLCTSASSRTTKAKSLTTAANASESS